MSPKTLIWIGVFVGSTVGSFIPTLWGDGALSFSSIIGSTVGGVIGILAVFKLSRMI
ncbi:MAG: hypothetical protein PHG25_03540 [Candidatus Pacebacteria bacterium]|nr:hypothetical protein [Candidatus Paceibacterota bacterium]